MKSVEELMFIAHADVLDQALNVIYAVCNRVNGKRYVGQTKRGMHVRLSEHVSAMNKPRVKGKRSAFHDALRKHGVEAFDVEILEVLSDTATKTVLNEAEIRWIEKLGTQAPCGYNLTPGGGGGTRTGQRATLETRKKQSVSAKNVGGWKRVPPDIEARRVENMKGTNNPYFRQKTPWQRSRPWTDDEKRAIGDAHRDVPLSDDHKQAIKAGVVEYYVHHTGPNLGKSWSTAMRQKQVVHFYLKQKPVFGFNEAGECVVTYLSMDDAREVTGLGYRTLAGRRRKPKFNAGITYRRSDITIAQLKELLRG